MDLRDFSLPTGKYVVAVSGGVDSVVLLHLLSTKVYRLKTELVVAHVDHAIRPDSETDAKFVQSLAEKYGLKFEAIRLDGQKTDEASLRQKRYEFLFSLASQYEAKLITAHHQNDLIETAIINVSRGTGPLGLAGMIAGKQILRPLLGVTKKEILEYAKANSLEWREDSTNQDTKYLRNRIRSQISSNLNEPASALINKINRAAKLGNEIDEFVRSELNRCKNEDGYLRAKLLAYDFKTLTYLVRQMLIDNGVTEVNRKLIERASLAVKTLPIGKKLELDKGHQLVSNKNYIQFTSTKRG